MKIKLIIFLVFAVLFFIIFPQTRGSSGRTKDGYYADVITSIGLKAGNLLNTSIREDVAVITSGSWIEEGNLQNLNEFRKVIIVCDEPLVLKGNRCDFNDVEGSDVFEYYKSSQYELNFIELGINGVSTVAIPERYFVQPNVRSNLLKEYFSSLDRSIHPNSYNNEDSTIVIVSKAYNFFETWTFELLVFSTVLITYFLFRSKLMGILEYFWDKILSIFTSQRFRRFLDLFSLIFFLVFSFVFVLLLISVKYYFTKELSVPGLFEYLTKIMGPSEIKEAFMSLRWGQLAVTLSFFMAGFGFIMNIISPAVRFLKTVAYKIKNLDLKESNGKLEILVLMSLLLGVLSIYFSFENTISILFLAAFINIIYFVYAGIQKKKDSLLRSKLILIAFTILFVLGIFYRNHRGNLEPKVDPDELIAIDDSVVTLPYYKDQEKSQIFSDFNIEVNEPIWVDNFLVAHPFYSKVINKSLDDLENLDRTDYIIVNYDEPIFYYKKILESPSFRDFVFTEEGTLTYFLSLEQNSSPRDIEVTTNFVRDCNIHADALTLKFDFYFKDEDQDFGVAKKTHRTAFLPDCNPDGKRFVEYRLPVDPPLLTGKGAVIIDVQNVSANSFDSFKLLIDGEEEVAGLKNISSFTNDKFLRREMTRKSNELYVFNNMKSSEFIVEQKSVINLGHLINRLNEKNELGNEFKIWTSSPKNAIIRNTL